MHTWNSICLLLLSHVLCSDTNEEQAKITFFPLSDIGFKFVVDICNGWMKTFCLLSFTLFPSFTHFIEVNPLWETSGDEGEKATSSRKKTTAHTINSMLHDAPHTHTTHRLIHSIKVNTLMVIQDC